MNDTNPQNVAKSKAKDKEWKEIMVSEIQDAIQHRRKTIIQTNQIGLEVLVGPMNTATRAAISVIARQYGMECFPAEMEKPKGKGICKFKIHLDLDLSQYYLDQVDTHEKLFDLVQAMIDGDADWPVKPTIEIF